MTELKIEIEKKFKNITMRLYANDIMNVIFADNCYVDIRDVEEVMVWVDKIGSGRLFLNLYEGAYNTDLSPEVREFAASSDNNKYTISDAMVISSQAHVLVTNFYVKFNKPVKPTRIFTHRDEAIAWLLEEKRRYYAEQKAS
ncbi:MAG: hypothetical protein H6598_08540 [Flavobacteriales bacterium]|nr:hypothetical protein [Flavobacteriales bacterium]MCB9196258.1 hypothetical protein [Flavobacteriales bacterium]